MIVKFLDKLGNLVKSITSIAYLPVDVEPVKDSNHLITSGGVAEIVPEGTSQDNPLMNVEDTEQLIEHMINVMKPIDAMTLRFEFSKKDYNPETAGVGSAGTWTKVDSPTLNIWDWTNEATDWSESFKGAFPDEDNEVSVIAAGDTSDVTKMDRLFAGVYTNNPNQTSYSLTSRNNIVSCIPFDVSNASISFMFTGSTLKHFIEFSTTKTAEGIFADAYIEEIGDVSFKCSDASQMFARMSNLKKVGVITFDESVLTSISALFRTSTGESPVEYIDGIKGTGNCSSFTNMFRGLNKLKKIGEEIDCSSVKDITAMFQACHSLVRIPLLKNIGNSNVTSTYYSFQSCRSITEVPLFDFSNVSDARCTFDNCWSLKSIPNYDVSSVTKVDYFCRNCYVMESGILETYNKFLDRGASITSHADAFKDCGVNTPQGQAALAQIPQSWGGLAEG